jgi:[acyl-carrier-protein] S-malonyltransferase
MRAAIFPGQGAQFVGMGRDVAEKHAAARDTYQQADGVLGFELSKLCFEGPDERLSATDIQQPAIFVTSVAVYRAAIDAGRFAPDDFGAMGGLSLGEYTALHLAGSIAFDDALRLVQQRGRLMQAASERQPGGMASVIGIGEDRVLALCEKVAAAGRVGPANFNCPGQIVISGDAAAVDAAVAGVEQFGGKAVALKVAGAFHSELMRPAADGLKPALQACDVKPPQRPVVANVDAEYHRDPAAIRDSLYRQVFNPVRWEACVRRLIADGCDATFEVGPGKVLTGLMRKIDRSVKATSIGAASDLARQ